MVDKRTSIAGEQTRRPRALWGPPSAADATVGRGPAGLGETANATASGVKSTRTNLASVSAAACLVVGVWFALIVARAARPHDDETGVVRHEGTRWVDTSPSVATIRPASQGFARIESAGQPEVAEQDLSDRPRASPTDAGEVVARLQRTASSVNQVLGTSFVAALGETGYGGESHGTGLVSIDFSLLCRLDDGALAVLVAHEFAHEMSVVRGRTPQPIGSASVTVEREAAADEIAGRAAASLGCAVDTFDELVEATDMLDGGPASPAISRTREMRLEAFQRGYDRACSALGRDATPTAGGPVPLSVSPARNNTIVENQRVRP